MTAGGPAGGRSGTAATGSAGRAVRVAFIGGHERVGSTLVARLIGAVPGCCSVGELALLWDEGLLRDEPCGCGRRFHDCVFWRSVGEEAFGGWDRVDAREMVALRRGATRSRHLPLVAAPRLAPARRRRLDRYAACLASLYQAIRVVSGCDIVVDSSKTPGWAYAATRAPGVDLRLIHLVRSSHGVCYSMARRAATGDGRTALRATLRGAASWTGLNLMLDAISLGTPALLVRYEDFIRAPHGGLDRVLAFLGHRAGPGGLDFLGERSAVLGADHSVAGNRMRLRAGPEPLALDEEYRTGLSRGTWWLISALTAPALARYGYPIVREVR